MRVFLEHLNLLPSFPFLCVPGSWFLMGQDHSFILAFLDLQFVYHKVKAYGQNPKWQQPIISQGNWLLIGNNNRTDWRWREKDRWRERKHKRETEGLIKNDWSVSHSRRIGWAGIKTERGRSVSQLSPIPAFIPFFLMSRCFFCFSFILLISILINLPFIILST